MFSEQGTTLGDGYQGASEYYSTSSDFLLYTRALIGDPGMMVWQATPGDMAVAFDSSPPVGASTMTITVTDNSIPVEGAYVCIHKVDEIYAAAKQVGIDMNYVGDYWHREISNMKGFIKYFQGTEQWSAIQQRHT